MAVANHWTMSIQDKFPIDGESLEHPKEIPLMVGPSFNIMREWRTSSDNTNAPEGHPILTEVSLSKESDKASPKMYFAACVGQLLGKVILTGWTTVSGKQEPVNKITLENTGISNISFAGGSENVTLAYTKIHWSYRDIGVASQQDAITEANWDRTTNKNE